MIIKSAIWASGCERCIMMQQNFLSVGSWVLRVIYVEARDENMQVWWNVSDAQCENVDGPYGRARAQCEIMTLTQV